MLRATEIASAGAWSGPPADVVRLDYDRRTRRRIALTGTGGLAFLLDLAKAPVLRAGDGIRLEDGRIVAVEAASEQLLEIACADARELARIAWHLGNRHLPTEILPDRLRIEPDPVIEEMVRGLGGSVHRTEARFEPEGGAYEHGGGAHQHNHDEHHHHDHADDHHHDHGHRHGG